MTYTPSDQAVMTALEEGLPKTLLVLERRLKQAPRQPLMALAGSWVCVAKVEVESKTTRSMLEAAAEPEVVITQRSQRAVAVDLLQDRGPLLRH